jgi:hypothetical protein
MAATCLRCDNVALEPREAAPSLEFFQCPNCKRSYARAQGQELTERWMGPLSLVLYGVLFEQHPAGKAEEIARQFLDQRSPADLRLIVQGIRDELARPTQKVRDILPGMAGSEAELREFLRRFADTVEPGIIDAERILVK